MASTVLPLFGGDDGSVELLGRNLLEVKGPDPGFGGLDYPLQPRTMILQLRRPS